MEKQITNLEITNPRRAWVVSELEKLVREWEVWQQEVAQIQDHPYDPNTHLEVFADGEENMQKHEILQAKTLTFLNNNIRGHGFIKGFDGRGCDRTDLRLSHRVKHRLNRLKILQASLQYEEVPDSFRKKKGRKLISKSKKNWEAIEDEFGISKISFGRKINFVSGSFKRDVIFRDVEHSFILASFGLSKPAVILAGGVIEELLRLYLKHKNIKPLSNNFDGYIRTCEQEKLLKKGIYRLSDSVRHFRNLVHLSEEKTKRHTISKATAKGAVASIFTIANDF